MNLEVKGADNALLVVSFQLGQATFGIDARRVQEVAKVGEITRVHHAPPEVVGVRNLRGRIVTIIDLRLRLGLGQVAAGPENRILIVEGQGEPVGLLVDKVADTLTAKASEVQPAPPNVHGVQGRHLCGVCRGHNRLVGLLDLASVLQSDQETNHAATRELRLA